MINLELTLSGSNLIGIAKKMAAHSAFNKRPPDGLTIGDCLVEVPEDWTSKLHAAKGRVSAKWGTLGDIYFAYNPPYYVSARVSNVSAASAPAVTIEIVATVPFEIATFGVLHETWLETYTPPSFGGMHALLGWACAFRGPGHDNLVSRRWLEYGPWRLTRADGDISFVQFHDLAADAQTALEQAKPGHERMGISETGGFLQTNYVYQTDVKGLYRAEERKLIITAVDTVSQLAMRDACAVRRRRRTDPEKPIEHIAYVFLTEELARAHLHELWLRELECWALIEGQNVRLDQDYAPPLEKPDWVPRLDS